MVAATSTSALDPWFHIWELEVVRIISKRAIREFAIGKQRVAMAPLEHWHETARRAEWRNSGDVRLDFNTADFVGDLVVFDIGGNKYRLIAAIKYRWQILYIRAILTHEDYDKGDWKK
jgi:mRNA interferase HigB